MFSSHRVLRFGSWLEADANVTSKDSVRNKFQRTMTTLDYPHITRAAGDVARLDRLPRIRVAQIAADHVGNGWSVEEIIRQHPHLFAAEVHAALGYYYDHREEVDGEITAEVAALDAAELKTPSPLRLRLLAIRRSIPA